MTDAAGSTLERLRLDVWLDVACLFKTRSESQKACKGGKIDVNGQRAKPHREVTPGDRISITSLRLWRKHSTRTSRHRRLRQKRNFGNWCGWLTTPIGRAGPLPHRVNGNAVPSAD